MILLCNYLTSKNCKNKDTKLINGKRKWRNKPSGKKFGNGYQMSNVITL